MVGEQLTDFFGQVKRRRRARLGSTPAIPFCGGSAYLGVVVDRRILGFQNHRLAILNTLPCLIAFRHDQTFVLNKGKTGMRFVLLAITVALSGCTTAGPYVTNISSDGANGLNIEKCKVELNGFIGVVNTGDCSNSTIKLSR